MPIATGTALLIGAGISAGASAYGANRASSANTQAAQTESAANTEAARIQAESADKALALQKDMYERRRGDLAPYLQTGTSSLSSLSNLMGLPAPSPVSGPAQPQTADDIDQKHIGGQLGSSSQSILGALQSSGQAPISLSPATGKWGLPGSPSFTLSNPITPAGAPQGYSTIKAPNGTTYYIPPEKVAEAISQGGKFVS